MSREVEYISIAAYFKVNGIKTSPNAFKKVIPSKIYFGSNIDGSRWNEALKEMFYNPTSYNIKEFDEQSQAVGFFIPTWTTPRTIGKFENIEYKEE